MRKLIVEEWISLDGYAADRAGKTEFFPTSEQNRHSDEDQLKFMETIDTILLGRKTYEIFADFWPKASTDQEIMADKLNSIPKVVISNTLMNAPWGEWSAATVISGDGVEAVRQLKNQPGKNIVLWGSISLAQALMKTDLIDEYHIQVCPTRTGGGRLLFPVEDSYRQLALIDTKIYDQTGVIFSKYEPKH
jgi:dihydrofolate reductase